MPAKSQRAAMHIAHQLKRHHIAQLNQWYRQQGWPSKHTTLFDTQKVINESSLVFAVLDGNDFVGCARIISNFTTRAYILDVIVSPERRGQGVGDYLMWEILASARLAKVPAFELQCADDLKPYYERFGFYTLASGKNSNIMYHQRELPDDAQAPSDMASSQLRGSRSISDAQSAGCDVSKAVSSKAAPTKAAATHATAPQNAVKHSDTTPARQSTVSSVLQPPAQPADKTIASTVQLAAQPTVQTSQTQSQSQADTPQQHQQQRDDAPKTVLSQALIDRLTDQARDLNVGSQTRLNHAAMAAFRERENQKRQAQQDNLLG